MSNNEFIVRGSYGNIICDATCGHVLRLEDHGGSREYLNIRQIDMKELRTWCADTGDKAIENGETDILNVGLWTDQGVYEGPEDDYRTRRTEPPLHRELRDLLKLDEDSYAKYEAWQAAQIVYQSAFYLAKQHSERVYDLMPDGAVVLDGWVYTKRQGTVHKQKVAE
jgi:hypothetical protein